MKDGIHAGDPLIHDIMNIISDISQGLIHSRETKLSGAKKGDGDIHTTNLDINIAIDGKYKIDAPKNPKVLTSDLQKIKSQASNHDRIGVLMTNYIHDNKEKIVATIDCEDLIKILTNTIVDININN